MCDLLMRTLQQYDQGKGFDLDGLQNELEHFDQKPSSIYMLPSPQGQLDHVRGYATLRYQSQHLLCDDIKDNLKYQVKIQKKRERL